MTDRLIPSPGGRPIIVYFYDGADWRPALLDTEMHLQIDLANWASMNLLGERSVGWDQIQVMGYTGSAVKFLRVDALGHLQVDVLSNVGLDDALHSVNTDELMVRGEDQLHSYEEPLGSDRDAAISGADGYCDSHSPADGLVWHVLEVSVRDKATATTLITITVQYGGAIFPVWSETATVGINKYVVAPCEFWLEHNDTCRVYFTGGLVGDQCEVVLVGEVFTKET